MREVQDHYFQLAKKEGFLSRAAYKLIEIDDRKKLLRKGDRVLDCGAAPGSWMQVAAKRVGPTGMVVGIDLQPIKHRFAEINIRLMQGDFTSTPPHVLLQLASEPARPRAGFTPESTEVYRHFDVVLSDMAPNTTGDPFSDHHRSVRLCLALLEVCPSLLRTTRGGGNLVMKVFEGEAYADLLKRTASMFETVKGFKPKASRSESTEMYIVATGYRPHADDAKAGHPAHERHAGPEKSKPAAGWK